MKRDPLLIKFISLLLTLSIVCTVGCLTVFAVGENEQVNQGQNENVVQEQQGAENAENNTPAPEVNPPAPQNEVQEQTPYEQEAPVYEEPLYEYIYGYQEDATTAYEKPQHLDDLPQVASEQVVEATAVAIPDVAVSDASLFSGIVMWLCVALGIAVIVGVLVSKRTRRRGV